MAPLALPLALAWLLQLAETVRVGCAPCAGDLGSAAGLVQVHPWRSWVPPAPNAPLTPCGCGGGASSRLTDRETLREMSDATLTALAQKLDGEIRTLKGQLSAEQAKNDAVLKKLQGRLTKLEEKGQQRDANATAEAEQRVSDRSDASHSLDADEAEIAKLSDGLTDAKGFLAKARANFEAVWLAARGCPCELGTNTAAGTGTGTGTDASLLSARQLLQAVAADPGAEHSKKIMAVEDREQQRADLKAQIEKEILTLSDTQRRILDRLDDLGVALRLKSRKYATSERADEVHAKILEHQAGAVKRYKANLQQQKDRIADTLGKAMQQMKALKDAVARCGCASEGR